MSTIVTRAGKGAPLTNTELDSNFTNLNTDKLEINAALGTPASVTLTNATGLPTAGLVDNAVTDAKLRDSAGLSVIGRGANSTGDPADIVAGTNKQVLRRDGSSLGFGAVDLSSNQAVTGTLPVNQGGTGITSFGSGVATWLGTPSSANLAAAVTDETGTGALVFGTNPVIDGVTIPARTNPLAQAVSVQMTASASVRGIQQLDNDNLDMGTNDFTLHWEGALPDWTPSAEQRLYQKFVGGVEYVFLRLSTSGNLIVSLAASGSVLYTATSTASVGIADNGAGKISAVVVRETSLANGSVTFYVNGVQLGSAVSITAAATVSISNAAVAIYMGGATARTAGNFFGFRLFNRALSAAEVLDLSINGVALADRGASQTPVYTSDFSAGADGWVDFASSTVTGNVDGIDGVDDVLEFEALTSNPRASTGADLRDIRDKQYFYVQFDMYHSGNLTTKGVQLRDDFFSARIIRVSGDSSSSAAFTSPDGEWTTVRGVFTTSSDAAIGGPIDITHVNAAGNAPSATAGDKVYIKNFIYKTAGLTSELIASNAQSNTGQIFDTSGNKNHALLPASGATVVGRPVSQTREVRWTNTWAGTNELQYIGGVNQAILPANAYIESIVGTVSGATPHDIIVGNGSDTDRYVTITTGLAAGTTNFALAARTTDGTNLKLTVDPDTDCSMSIAWLIRYSTLEA
jgi:hypothetical protein